MTAANPDQADYWNAPGAERWVREQARLDRVLAPLQAGAMVHAAPATGEHVVDIGCGCGASSLTLADAVGASGSVLGVDLSQPMLKRAAERAGQRTHLSFVQADAAVHAFSQTADLVFSRFGCMFFNEPVQAFANIRSALKPDGRMCLLCWRGPEDNPWHRTPVAVASRFVEVPPPPAENAPGPMSLSRAERVHEVLAAAGYRDIQLTPFDAEIELSTTGVDEAVDFSLQAGPLARLLTEADEQTLGKIRTALHDEFAKHCQGETVALAGGAWIVTAHA